MDNNIAGELAASIRQLARAVTSLADSAERVSGVKPTQEPEPVEEFILPEPPTFDGRLAAATMGGRPNA